MVNKKSIKTISIISLFILTFLTFILIFPKYSEGLSVFMPQNNFTNKNMSPIIAIFSSPEVSLLWYSLKQGNIELQMNVSSYLSNNSRRVFVFTPTTPYIEDALYNFSIFARDLYGIPMAEPETFLFYADYTPPKITFVSPANNTILATQNFTARVTANEPILKISYDIYMDSDRGEEFKSSDMKNFVANLSLEDGIKLVNITVWDRAGNNASVRNNYMVHTGPTKIFLVYPPYGETSINNVKIKFGTNFYAQCKYSINEQKPYESMTGTITYDNLTHETANAISITNYTDVYVKCFDMFQEYINNSFRIYYNPTKPQILSMTADPETITEYKNGKLSSVITAVTDIDTLCKYDFSDKDYDLMENYFQGDNPKNVNTFKKTHTVLINTFQDKRNYTIYASCMAKNMEKSNKKNVKITIDLTSANIMNIISPKPYSPNIFSVIVETNRDTTCGYGPSQDAYLSDGTFNVLGKHHESPLITLVPGNYTYYFKCQFAQETIKKNLSFVVDDSPPSQPTINISDPESPNESITFRTDKIRAVFNSTDPESGIKGYNYTVKRDDFANKSIILNWSFTSSSTLWISNLNLVNGSKYKVTAKAINNAGFESLEGDSNIILVDTSLRPNLCNNSIKDSTETDVDCGGSCPPCAPGKNCTTNEDCIGICDILRRVCIAADTCSNGALDPGETDVDCGGICVGCEIGKNCTADEDCLSMYCSEEGKCEEYVDLCNDGILNGDETDIDCGGKCNGCGLGKRCKKDSDCSLAYKCDENTLRCVEIPEDSDNDGVPDDIDKCKNTPKNCEVDETGCQKNSKCKENDKDGDGIPDSYDIDPNKDDSSEDYDGDGLTNLEEYKYKTNPKNPDTDGDGYTDKEEIEKGTDPNDPESKPSSILPLLLFIIGLIIIIGAFGYYVYYSQMKKKKPVKQIPATKQQMPQQMEKKAEAYQAPKQYGERVEGFKPKVSISEALAKIRMQAEKKQKEEEREKIFSAFASGKEEEIKKIEVKEEKKEESKAKEEAEKGKEKEIKEPSLFAKIFTPKKVVEKEEKKEEKTKEEVKESKEESKEVKEDKEKEKQEQKEQKKEERPKSKIEILKMIQKEKKKAGSLEKLKSEATKKEKVSSIEKLKKATSEKKKESEKSGIEKLKKEQKPSKEGIAKLKNLKKK